jgi:hypothetical protein
MSGQGTPVVEIYQADEKEYEINNQTPQNKEDANAD